MLCNLSLSHTCSLTCCMCIHTYFLQAFAALPLPISTKLPIQINSSFEVKSDRQSLWYMDSQASLQGYAKLKSAWNQKLIEELVPDAYLSALKYLAQNNIMSLEKLLSLVPGSGM